MNPSPPSNPSSSPSAQTSIHRAAVPRVSVLRRWLRRAERCLAVLALLFILWLILPFQEWIYRSLDRQGDLRHAKYLLCLGGSGSRVVEAAKLMQEGWADRLIVMNNGDYSDRMRDQAIAWGVPPERIGVDHDSYTTRDHPPGAIALGVDPKHDTCIVVTSYTHMARSQALFERAGFTDLIFREPRWEREPRNTPGWRYGWMIRLSTMPELMREGGAWLKAKWQGDL